MSDPSPDPAKQGSNQTPPNAPPQQTRSPLSPALQTNITTGTLNDGSSSPARSSRNGWDGKLRIGDRNRSKDDEAETSDEDSDQEEGDQSGNGVLNGVPRFPPSQGEILAQQGANLTGPGAIIPHPAPLNQPGVRRAVVQNAAPVEGEQIPQDEDLLEDFELDTEEIDLVHCRISDIEKLGLQRYTNLERLCLRQNAIQDMSPLPTELAAKLRELDLYDNLIKHINGLESFTDLKVLDLSFNKIKHIKRVKQCTDLTDLYFVQNRISEIEGLEGLTKLRNLELGGNRVRTIANLETLTGLEELWLGKNKITEIQGLSTLTNLTILSIQSNRLTSITGLTSLPHLSQLHISHNALTSLSGLESNTALTVLDISSNPIKELAHLENLTHLEEFWASYCLFESFNDVQKQLSDKAELETVYFEGTPLQRRQPVLYRNKVRLALPGIKQIDAS